MFRTNRLPRKKSSLYLRLKELFHKEDGAIDLASIMVGIIVIGMIGGVTAATVFAVVPWTQDKAAKQQLTSIAAAQNAYFGLSADPQSANLPAGTKPNGFASSAELQAANLLATADNYCTSVSRDRQSYEAYSKSDSGEIFLSTDKNTSPVAYSGSLPSDCLFLFPAYTDPNPTTTTMTFICDTATTGAIPMISSINGTESWNDGVTRTYTGASSATSRSFEAGVTYKMNFVGTYYAVNSTYNPETIKLSSCLVSVDHWGLNTGVVDGTAAFRDAKKLTSVPAHLPPTITSTAFMFMGASSFNDSNVSKWNVSNVTVMVFMFSDALSFNQPLHHWNVSNVTTLQDMFSRNPVFNQPLNNWDVSKVDNMRAVFYKATAFNQPLNSWNVSSVTNATYMFRGATAFNQPLDSWNVSNVTTMHFMFSDAKSFNQPIGNWNTSNVNDMQDMFSRADKFNQPINNWNVSKVTSMRAMFLDALSFNQPLNNWNTVAVNTTEYMFHNAAAFNQPLNNWNTAKVTDMNYMFALTPVFNQNISMWSLASNPTGVGFRNGSALTAANSPFGV